MMMTTTMMVMVMVVVVVLVVMVMVIMMMASHVMSWLAHLDQEDRSALIHNNGSLSKAQTISAYRWIATTNTGQWQSSEGNQTLHTGNHWLCVSTIGCPGHNMHQSL